MSTEKIKEVLNNSKSIEELRDRYRVNFESTPPEDRPEYNEVKVFVRAHNPDYYVLMIEDLIEGNYTEKLQSELGKEYMVEWNGECLWADDHRWWVREIEPRKS